MDYYSILGVNKNASQDDIRKAYKKQCMKHHPDRGGDEEAIKKVNEAYNTLKDPQKRSDYDNPQPQFRFNSQDFGGANPFEEMFRNPFGFGGQQPRHKNRDVRVSYTIDLADCYTGKGVTIQYKTPSGKVEALDIHIPVGAKPGDMIRFAGYGDDSIPRLPRGDLILKLNVRASRSWSIDGLDLYSTQSVSVFDLLLGGELLITSPEGKMLSLKIPKGTQSGTTFSMHGYGIPHSKTGRKGKLYIKVLGKIPKIDNEELLTKIEAIKNELD